MNSVPHKKALYVWRKPFPKQFKENYIHRYQKFVTANCFASISTPCSFFLSKFINVFVATLGNWMKTCLAFSGAKIFYLVSFGIIFFLITNFFFSKQNFLFHDNLCLRFCLVIIFGVNELDAQHLKFAASDMHKLFSSEHRNYPSCQKTSFWERLYLYFPGNKDNDGITCNLDVGTFFLKLGKFSLWFECIFWIIFGLKSSKVTIIFNSHLLIFGMFNNLV